MADKLDLIQCYRILEIDSGASLQEIKQAYRDLVKVWHPDHFCHDLRLQEKAQEKLKTINQAYDFLQSRHFTTVNRSTNSNYPGEDQSTKKRRDKESVNTTERSFSRTSFGERWGKINVGMTEVEARTVLGEPDGQHLGGIESLMQHLPDYKSNYECLRYDRYGERCWLEILFKHSGWLFRKTTSEVVAMRTEKVPFDEIRPVGNEFRRRLMKIVAGMNKREVVRLLGLPEASFQGSSGAMWLYKRDDSAWLSFNEDKIEKWEPAISLK